MELKKVLSCIGGYLDSTEFELDLPKIADVSEYSEEDVIAELGLLKSTGDINMDGSVVTLVNIKPIKNKKFNELYAPVETIDWQKGMKLVLDK